MLAYEPTRALDASQGINPAGDVSEVQALAGGDLLQSWLLHAQSKLPQAKTYRSGSTALLQALQQVLSRSVAWYRMCLLKLRPWRPAEHSSLLEGINMAGLLLSRI